MKFYFLSLILSLFFFAQAQAGVDISNGVVTISVSGADGYNYSDDASGAGNANIVLSYADAAKTIVHITGTLSHYGKSSSVDQSIALKDLKGIRVYAVGGNGADGQNGYNGQDGSRGSDGSNGSDGWDGCPPSSGSNGSDGSRGGDGSDGSRGGDGGNGGNGGAIHVSTSPDQSELLLYVSMDASSGSGGSGGYGGSGGNGGDGGEGGHGGRGGRNNCRDDKGQPISGPDASDGSNGSDGSRGNSGSSGWNGSDGNGGRAGSYSYDLSAPTGTQNFKAPFDLEITAAKFLDDNEDSILEPGERVYLSSLTVTNKGPMPSPQGQSIQLSFGTSSTLISPTTLNGTLSALASGASQTLTFKKGALPLQVPDQSSLIGKKAVAKGILGINNVHMSYDVDSGMAVHWPVTISAANSSSSGLFEVPSKQLVYTLKNVGVRDLGAGGSQPLYIEINWTSKTVPGSDVSIALADGRIFSLAQAVQLSDLKVPANASVTLPVALLVHDSKALGSASGSLTVSLRLRDFNSGDQDVLQSLSTAVNMNLDVNSIAWNQTLSFARSKVQCVFPSLTTPAQPIASVQITKAAGSSQVQIQVEVPGSAESSTSPVITISASHAFAYLEQFRTSWTSKNAVDFLNTMVGPNAPRGPWSFKSCTAAP